MTLADMDDLIAEKNQALQKQQLLIQNQEQVSFATVHVNKSLLHTNIDTLELPITTEIWSQL